MGNHTSGEWIVDESRHDGCINRLEPFRHIAMVSAYQAVAGDREENEANATLIAAAPDLLHALEAMVDTYEYEAAIDHPSLLAARAAIAKARKTAAK